MPQSLGRDGKGSLHAGRPAKSTARPIMGRLDEVYINGSMEHRLPGI